MIKLLKLVQVMGMLLVGIGLFHGLFDADATQGMWYDLYYFVTGIVLFYGCYFILRRMGEK